MSASLEKALVLRSKTRRLRIYTNAEGSLCCAFYPPKDETQRIAFASKSLGECSLEMERGVFENRQDEQILLWMGSVCVDLARAEAEQVAVAFEASGLRVSRTRVDYTCKPARVEREARP